MLPWLWCRPAAAAPIQPLGWELLYATGAAVKRREKRKEKKESFRVNVPVYFCCADFMTKPPNNM